MHGGDGVDRNAGTCSETRNVVVGTDYNYACANTYNPRAKTWTTSGCLRALERRRRVRQELRDLRRRHPADLQDLPAGHRRSRTTRDLRPDVEVSVGTNYVYDAYKLWNGSAYVPTAAETALINASAAGTCQLQATNCTADYPAPDL